jgi:hypothetical protein
MSKKLCWAGIFKANFALKKIFFEIFSSFNIQTVELFKKKDYAGGSFAPLEN